MSTSASTRSDLVLRALKLAGRGVELKTLANELLNDMLRDWALGYKFPSLRVLGSGFSLLAGSQTAALPTDFGCGVDNLTFGTENVPLDEKSSDDFVNNLGIQPSNVSSGRPRFYTVDENDGVFRFNCVADKNYPFIPIYFKAPANIDTSSSGDLQKVWMKNDELVVQGLIQRIYQYKQDDREFVQEQKVQRLMAEYKRGLAPMSGGSPRIMLARGRFKRP